MSNSTLRAALTDVFAGTVCSILSIAYCLSYAALIFTGPLEPLLAYGIAVTFLSAAVGGAIVAMRSSLSFAVAGPDSSISVVLAALVATLVQRLPINGAAGLLAPVLIAMALATALTGLLLCVLGFTHAGRAIRFVPYPVIGGFLGATGWLLITGAIQVVTGLRPALDNFPAFADIAVVTRIAPGIVVALMLYALLRRYSKSPFVLPAVLLTALAVTHLVLLLTGTTISAAQDQGWLFRLQPAAGMTLPWRSAALRSFPWSSVPQIAGDGLAVIFVTIANFLLNTTGLEIATRGEANIERDLKVLGLANVVIAALGGYVSCTSFSRSMLVRTAGATSRIGGLTVAVISAAVLVADPAFLSYVPKYILGGLLFYLGADLVYQWLVQSSRRLSRVEYLSLLAIAALIIYAGFIAGVLIGIVIGCATFALSASRVNAIKFSFDGSEYRSSLDRGPYELSLMADHGREIQGMTLQSYLFFGSANRLYQHVKALLAAQPDCHFLIFDFRLVTGIDSSATHSFAQIKQIAGASGARLVLVNLTVELERAFHTARFISDGVMVVSDLDRALEFCEQSIIEAHRTAAGDERSLRVWWTDALGAANADRLAEFCLRCEVPAGQIIAREGEPAASMHFILEGRIGIVADMGEGRTMRLRSLGPHTTIGEMGLITGYARSATIAAEADSVLYELTAEAYERIKREQPALSQALLGYIVSVMSERLSFANRAVGVLQR
ncbi:MAG: SulP family inorganic anion transporter [Xanthobacteraceae bacterium]